MDIIINSWLPCVKVLGPGSRAIVWVQGCNKNCYGCISPEMKKMETGTRVNTTELAKKIIKLDNIEGVTISGGEPFIQAQPLYEFLRFIKINSRLTTMLYTGFTLYEVMQCPTMKACLDYIDLLIDGEYRSNLPQSKWRGSNNQFLYSPTGYYNLELINEWNKSPSGEIEMHLLNDSIVFVGITNEQVIKEIRRSLEQKGIKIYGSDEHES